MKPWLIMLGTGFALIGLQAVQAQVTIDITKITCNQFLASQITDSRTLGVYLNGYVNGERGKTLIDPLSTGHLMPPETFLVPTNRRHATDGESYRRTRLQAPSDLDDPPRSIS
jgi:hypothetical protein